MMAGSNKVVPVKVPRFTQVTFRHRYKPDQRHPHVEPYSEHRRKDASASDDFICQKCNASAADHGVLDCLDTTLLVCPGDEVLIGIARKGDRTI